MRNVPGLSCLLRSRTRARRARSAPTSTTPSTSPAERAGRDRRSTRSSATRSPTPPSSADGRARHAGSTCVTQCGEGQDGGCVQDQEEAASDVAASRPVPAEGSRRRVRPGADTDAAAARRRSLRRRVEPTRRARRCSRPRAAAAATRSRTPARTGRSRPNLDDAQPSEALVVDRVTNGQGAMPAFKGQLDRSRSTPCAVRLGGGRKVARRPAGATGRWPSRTGRPRRG